MLRKHAEYFEQVASVSAEGFTLYEIHMLNVEIVKLHLSVGTMGI